MHQEALQQEYQRYREELSQCAKKQRPTDGLFGFGRAMKDDACHERFDERLGKLIADMAARSPGSEETEDTIRFMFTQTSLYPYPESAQWMLYATERHILLLVPFLTVEAAGRLCGEYGKRYRKWNRLPVQRKVFDALKKQSAAK